MLFNLTDFDIDIFTFTNTVLSFIVGLFEVSIEHQFTNFLDKFNIGVNLIIVEMKLFH